MEPLAAITTIGVFGVVIKSVVDAARRQFPRLDGAVVQAVALALGAAAAWAFDIRGAEALLEYVGAAAARTPHVAVDYLVTGAAIASGAGFLAEITGRSGGGDVIVEVDSAGNPL